MAIVSAPELVHFEDSAIFLQARWHGPQQYVRVHGCCLYFFTWTWPPRRHESLRHVRIEQVVRYFATASGLSREETTMENTVEVDDAVVACDSKHQHYDPNCENMPPGTKLLSTAQGLEVLQRRRQARLGVSRLPLLEPLGAMRESFYEQKLLCNPML